MKTIALSLFLLFSSAALSPAQIGHDAAAVAKDTGKDVEKLGKVTVKGTEKGVHSLAKVSAKGANKVASKTKTKPFRKHHHKKIVPKTHKKVVSKTPPPAKK